MGFTTSRSPSHETPDRRPVASRLATWDEIRRLVGVMGELNTGIFEIAGERFAGDPHGLRDYHVRLRDLAVDTGRPITFGLFSRKDEPTLWRIYLALLEETAAAGGRMFAQVHSRALTVVLSFKTSLPFDRLPVWKELRALPLDEQKRRLRDGALRSRLVEAARERDERRPIGAEARPAAYEWIFLMDDPVGPHRSIASIAAERQCDPVEAMIDLALERDLDRFFLQPIANENQDDALELIRHPRTAVTFSDSGAHVSQIMDASLQTHLLAHWVRDKQALTLEEAVRRLSFDNATHWGFADRGLIREGFAADLVVFDPRTVGPEMPEVANDLPAGARRLVQRARGFSATVVNGEPVLRDGKHTGALPGRLLRAGAGGR
jgi:N-acyl-D-aspartate/D-glutamate deacylase